MIGGATTPARERTVTSLLGGSLWHAVSLAQLFECQARANAMCARLGETLALQGITVFCVIHAITVELGLWPFAALSAGLVATSIWQLVLQKGRARDWDKSAEYWRAAVVDRLRIATEFDAEESRALASSLGGYTPLGDECKPLKN